MDRARLRAALGVFRVVFGPPTRQYRHARFTLALYLLPQATETLGRERRGRTKPALDDILDAELLDIELAEMSEEEEA